MIRSRYLAWMSVILLASLWWFAGSADLGAVPTRENSAKSLSGVRTELSNDERHYVTPDQLATSGQVSGRSIVPFLARTHEGRDVDWSALSEGKPVVVIFIKEGCPCSVEFEPVFHRIAAAYQGCARFVGVIDGSVEVARQYAVDNHVPYPVLADEQLEIVSKFGVSNAAYVALVDSAGTIRTLWPGCSAEMLQALCRELSSASGENRPPIDPTGMPGPLTTGCPYR